MLDRYDNSSIMKRYINQKKKLLIFHPGLAKSGTTAIQEHFNNFINTENLFYENKLSKYNSLTFKLFCLTSNKIKNKKNINTFLRLINTTTKNNKTYIFSFEGIFNNIRFNEKNNLYNFFYIINKLKNKFRIKILLTVRNQIDIINSLYVSHYGLLHKKYPNVDRFIQGIILKNNKIDFFDYMFMSKFIYKNTRIMPQFILFEDLKFNRRKYTQNLTRILENKNKKLNFKNSNKTKILNKKFVVFSGNIFYFLSKINTYLKKKIFFFEFFTQRIVYFLKKFFPKKLIEKSSSNINFLIIKKYHKSNKEFFEIAKNNCEDKNYRKYFNIN